MLLKKVTAAVSALVLTAGMASVMPQGSSAVITASADSEYNYAEALQKSMFFYEVQQSGVLPDWNNVQWRDNSMVDEDGNDTDFVKGGWFDAGDHFKFTLTNAYSASIMAWGYIEYKDAVDKAGLGELYRNNLKWGLDYVLGCDQGNGKMVGTIGDFSGGSTDHNIWCSAEVYLRKHNLNSKDWVRPYDVVENSTVSALSAAALAQGYLIFKDSDPATANNYLKHAKDLYAGADRIRDSEEERGGMGSMYPTSTWVDDCMYAALWLYKATGDSSYLTKVETDYIPKFPTESQSTTWKYSWGLCWDDTTQAAALLYAQITGKQEWVNHIDKHIRYWMGEGSNGGDIKPFEGKITADGLSHLTNWGSLRHATNTAWVAKLASDTLFKNDAAKAKKYNDWAKTQMDYCLGDNALGLTYVLGMGEKNPIAIHHRTASGIHDDHWNELGKESSDEGWQTEYAHTLYGALIGGPDSTGAYDVGKIGVGQYEYTEVAIDYNAGYTAALCAMIEDFGGKPLANFPEKEEPKWAEWEVAAVLNGKGNSYTEIKAWAMNHTAWPARVAKDIEYRYYFDASEIFAAGLTIDDITVKSNSQQYQEGQQGYATVTGPFVYEGDKTGNTLYASIKFEDGRAIQPTGQSEHRDEVQFRVSIPDAVNGKPTTGAWDPTNDWSYKGGIATASNIKSDDALNQNMPMYVNGIQVWGVEPDGTKPTKSDYTFTRGGGNTDPDPVVDTPKLSFEALENGVKLDWTSVSGATNYAIYCYQNNNWIKLTESKANTYTFKNLKEGNYKVAVLAYVNDKWNVDYSNAIVVSPKASSGTTVPNVTGISYDQKNHTVTLKWDAVSGAQAYGVAYYSAGKWRICTQSISPKTLSWTSPKLPAGKSYKVTVAAKVNGSWDTNGAIKSALTVTIK
ncbi:Cellulose binding domain-containing protein [Ruminococcus sp. YE71]|uniref:glycoside hydrolase family 9 protein n=1 Tax=unclassified Ruminococcus TaxID=2608920 RepID=UPI000881C21B|nr:MULTISPECIES: glycoside hydrolase family 9 protein [unclassified Ruminococcus]SDA29859.1 Cellulose binding domain-containing protein [Ruminococcus sp. YE78]SFW48967.1 Cellulose binding domain-containing protein [Ruminococcus sp. YE71]